MKYKVKKMNPLGDHDEKYGTRYWGEVEEADMPVSFNLMNPKDIPAGAELEFEEKTIKETKKGTEYMFLRKVRVLGGAPSQTQLPAPDITQKLDAIIGNQKLMMSWLRELAGKEEPEEDKVVDVDPDEEVDLSSIPF